MNFSSPGSVRLLGNPVSLLGMDGALMDCEARVAAKSGGYVCFVNVHTVTESQWNPQLREALSVAQLGLADGMPLVWLSKLKKKPIGSRVCGPDFMKEFFRRNPGFTYGLLGGAPGVAEKVAAAYGVPAVCYSPPLRPFSADNVRDDLTQLVLKSPDKQLPRVVWVGLGAPKQELWMHAARLHAPQTLFLGVGAAFDFLAGTKARAPLWMREAGLEWLFRLGSEPRRLFKRYFVTNSVFLILALLDWVKGEK